MLLFTMKGLTARKEQLCVLEHIRANRIWLMLPQLDNSDAATPKIANFAA
jgi:hypothetical protein